MNAAPPDSAPDSGGKPASATTRQLSGFGRIKPSLAHIVRPQRRGQLTAALLQTEGAVLARGYGRAYGDAAQLDGGTVIDMTRLDRLLDFDPATGQLVCEAGISLAAIDQVFVPRGFALPVVAGTGFVSVGGAIAADIHGKNHDSVGSFGHHLDWVDHVVDAIAGRGCGAERGERQAGRLDRRLRPVGDGHDRGRQNEDVLQPIPRPQGLEDSAGQSNDWRHHTPVFVLRTAGWRYRLSSQPWRRLSMRRRSQSIDGLQAEASMRRL
jgi:hypothetical protein